MSGKTDYEKIRSLQQEVDRINKQIKLIESGIWVDILMKQRTKVKAEILQLKQLELSRTPNGQ